MTAPPIERVIETQGLRRVFKSRKRAVEAVAGALRLAAIVWGARAFSRAAV